LFVPQVFCHTIISGKEMMGRVGTNRGEAVKQYTIEHLMVPLSEYATVRVGSTLYEAILALEQAQEEFDQGRYKHRGMLVLNGHGRVIGKLNHLDALQALEPEIEEDIATTLVYYGFGQQFPNRA
jgi:hypothetical protein